jgi:ribosomal protein L7/L12
MVHNISGLLISLKQMYEMASHLSQKPVTELLEAYQVCRAEALKNNARWVPVDYPQNSDAKKTRIVLVLYEHPSEEKIDVIKSNRTKLARTAKERLKVRGMSGTEKIKFVTTDDPFYY